MLVDGFREIDVKHGEFFLKAKWEVTGRVLDLREWPCSWW